MIVFLIGVAGVVLGLENEQIGGWAVVIGLGPGSLYGLIDGVVVKRRRRETLRTKPPEHELPVAYAKPPSRAAD